MGLLDQLFGGAPQQPQVPAPQSGGFLGGQVDPRMLMDLGMGILAANKPSLTPTNLGATLAGGYDYMRGQQATRADQEYNKAMSQAAMAKANKFDLKSKGQEILAKKMSGADLTPEEDAALKAYDLDRTTQMGSRYNPETLQFENYPKYQSVIPQILGAGRTGTSPAVAAPASQPSLVPPPEPISSAPLPPQIQSNVPTIDGAIPAIPISPQEQAGRPITTPRGAVPFAPEQIQIAQNETLSMPNTPPALNNPNLTPRQQNVLQIEQAKIDLQSATDKQKAEENFKQSWLVGKSKMNSNFKQLDKAIESITPWSTGNLGAAMSIMPDSERNTLNNYLLPIKQAVASGELAQMRKDFGSVGQITEKEWARFDSALGSLDTLDPEQLASNLQTIKESWTNISTMNDLRASGIPPEQIEAVIGGDLISAAQIVAQTGNPITIAKNGEILEIDTDFAKQALEATRGR